MLDISHGPLSRLIDRPRIYSNIEKEYQLQSESKEQDDNRKNRRKECATQGQRACARIGNCLVRVLACVFD